MNAKQMKLILIMVAKFFPFTKPDDMLVTVWMDTHGHWDAETFRKAIMLVATDPNRNKDNALHAPFPRPDEVNKAKAKLEPQLDCPWISEAPRYHGEKWDDPTVGRFTIDFSVWRDREARNRYQAVDSYGEIVLVQNPESWDCEYRNGSVAFIKQPSVKTGKKAPRKEAVVRF